MKSLKITFNGKALEEIPHCKNKLDGNNIELRIFRIYFKNDSMREHEICWCKSIALCLARQDELKKQGIETVIVAEGYSNLGFQRVLIELKKNNDGRKL